MFVSRRCEGFHFCICWGLRGPAACLLITASPKSCCSLDATGGVDALTIQVLLKPALLLKTVSTCQLPRKVLTSSLPHDKGMPRTSYCSPKNFCGHSGWICFVISSFFSVFTRSPKPEPAGTIPKASSPKLADVRRLLSRSCCNGSGIVQNSLSTLICGVSPLPALPTMAC